MDNRISSHPTAHSDRVVLTVLIVALHVKVGEVEGDAILVRGHYLPDTVLVGGIQVREGGALYGPICLINVPSTGIFTLFAIRMKFITNFAFTFEAAQGVDTNVVTAMMVSSTFIILFDKRCCKS